MFEKDKIAIDLGATNIKIMVGNKKLVKYFEIIKTPEDSIQDDKIVSLEGIKNSLQLYLNKNNIKTKDVAFSIHGQDVVSRHTEVPIMDEAGIKTSLDWEMNQYLPKDAGEYIIDYEIIEKIETAEKKALKLLVAAVPKEKINRIVKLTEMLNLQLAAIDITSNCACRVFKGISKKDLSKDSIGVIDIGSNNTNIIILDKGKLFIEREIPFGVNNMLKEIIKKENIEHNSAFSYLEENISFVGNEEGSELEKRIISLFDNVLSSLEKIVTFFTIGKVKNNLDGIYLIGVGSSIQGLKEHVSGYFNCPVFILDNAESVGVKTSISKECDIKNYVGTLGLLLRKE
jgi:type IV pilus assembly protein PilM